MAWSIRSKWRSFVGQEWLGAVHHAHHCPGKWLAVTVPRSSSPSMYCREPSLINHLVIAVIPSVAQVNELGRDEDSCSNKIEHDVKRGEHATQATTGRGCCIISESARIATETGQEHQKCHYQHSFNSENHDKPGFHEMPFNLSGRVRRTLSVVSACNTQILTIYRTRFRIDRR